jgi:AcrR family transcriptional regulator
MPTPARTSVPEIVAAGRAILESDGLDGLTMQRVAEMVGVRSPSLYKRVRGRTDLIRLIAESVVDELAATMDTAAGDPDPVNALRTIAHAFRSFALAHPNAYALLFARHPDDVRIDPERNARASESLLRTAGRLAGPDDALEAARTVTAWAHGFVTMELAGAFQLGGDVDRAFDYGIDHLAAALSPTVVRRGTGSP